MKDKGILTLLFLLVMLSCDTLQPWSPHTGLDAAYELPESDFMTVPHDGGQCFPAMWVCHNPASKLHNQACQPGCMVPGNSGTYCWYRGPQCDM